LKNLKDNKAAGPDNLKKVDLTLTPIVAEILTSIYNYSIALGELPDKWKIAHIVPIFKKGEKIKPSNYRPVSLTSIPCKILEHIILHQLHNFLGNSITKHQHGFRKLHSCNTQLVSTLHTILQQVDDGKCVQAVALDFSKAFDKVCHSLLIKKLRVYNIPSLILEWIKSFLHNRQQRVIVDGVLSELVRVTSGVPQGSVLGPFLFLVYINDIGDSISSHIKLFADDTLMFSSLENYNSVLSFQNDLSKLESWAHQWKMEFNPSKCSLIFFGKTPVDLTEINYNFCNTTINAEETVKYLGIYINNNLKWEKHINSIITKATRVLGYVQSTLYNAPLRVKLLAYLTLCRPVLEYACEAWDPYYAKDIYKLELVQNKALRFILNLKGIQSMSDARDRLRINTLESRRKSCRLKLLTHLITNDNICPNISNTFTRLTSHPSVLTRHMNNNVPRSVLTNCNLYFNSFLPRTIRDLRIPEVTQE
jgi:hypothetical protein